MESLADDDSNAGSEANALLDGLDTVEALAAGLLSGGAGEQLSALRTLLLTVPCAEARLCADRLCEVNVQCAGESFAACLPMRADWLLHSGVLRAQAFAGCFLSGVRTSPAAAAAAAAAPPRVQMRVQLDGEHVLEGVRSLFMLGLATPPVPSQLTALLTLSPQQQQQHQQQQQQ